MILLMVCFYGSVAPLLFLSFLFFLGFMYAFTVSAISFRKQTRITLIVVIEGYASSSLDPNKHCMIFPLKITWLMFVEFFFKQL